MGPQLDHARGCLPAPLSLSLWSCSHGEGAGLGPHVLPSIGQKLSLTWNYLSVTLSKHLAFPGCIGVHAHTDLLVPLPRFSRDRLSREESWECGRSERVPLDWRLEGANGKAAVRRSEEKEAGEI